MSRPPSRGGGTPRWPNLFVVGAGRAGTTTVYHCLKQHPDIYMSPIKEPHFFSSTLFGPWLHTVETDDEYLSLFRGASEQRMLGEASISYLPDPEAARAIRRVSPEARIIAILREPIDRAYSHYLLARSWREEQRPFLEALREPTPSSPYALFGLYCAQVRTYLDLFERVLVLFYEEIFPDLRRSLRRVFEFLEVDPEVAERVRVRRHNVYARPRGAAGLVIRATAPMQRSLPARVRAPLRHALFSTGRKPALDSEARRFLTELYAGERQCLKALLGVDPPWREYEAPS